MKFLMKWSIGFGVGSSTGGNLDDVNWCQLKEKLDIVLNDIGSITLTITDWQEIGPHFLQVLSDGGAFFLSLGEDNGSDYVIRDYRSPCGNTETVIIHGNYYSNKSVCYDRELIFSVFEDFYLTGNVSHEILN